MDTDEENKKFNIYYLNFSKVYEISMMINNVFKSSIWKEETDLQENSRNKGSSISAGIGFKNITKIESKISDESSIKNATSSKLIESLTVITTKSLLLQDIIRNCKIFTAFNSCEEGDLLKIDKLSLSILDEDILRAMSVLRKNALKDFKVEGYEVNNLISSMLQDYSYILKGVLVDNESDGDNESNDALIIKIPSEIENEFENKYNVYDLLIGHLSIIGVYKGKVSEEFIKSSTFNYFANMETQQSSPVTNSRVINSSNRESNSYNEVNSSNSDTNTEFHFIDIIALIQDIQFKEDETTPEKNLNVSMLDKFLNFVLRRDNNG